MSEEDWAEVRRATLADVPFIRRLALESTVFTIPDGRAIANETVAERAAEALKNLELLVHRRKEAAVLVAVDKTDGTRAGYAIVEFKRFEETTGDLQAHLWDMGVEQAYMGKFIAHRLVRASARASHDAGYRYMSATVSASNPRALMSAVKIGFDIERYGLIMACGPGGIEPMPGRPPEQRGHALNRIRRQESRLKKIHAREQDVKQ